MHVCMYAAMLPSNSAEDHCIFPVALIDFLWIVKKSKYILWWFNRNARGCLTIKILVKPMISHHRMYQADHNYYSRWWRIMTQLDESISLIYELRTTKTEETRTHEILLYRHFIIDVVFIIAFSIKETSFCGFFQKLKSIFGQNPL